VRFAFLILIRFLSHVNVLIRAINCTLVWKRYCNSTSGLRFNGSSEPNSSWKVLPSEVVSTSKSRRGSGQTILCFGNFKSTGSLANRYNIQLIWCGVQFHNTYLKIICIATIQLPHIIVGDNIIIKYESIKYMIWGLSIIQMGQYSDKTKETYFCAGLGLLNECFL